MAKLSVTFEYNKTDDGSKMLKAVFPESYTQEEKDELIEYIIDTFLPTGMGNPVTSQLGTAWGIYKDHVRYEKEHKN